MALFAAALWVGGCGQLGLPRVALTAAAPDGTRVAFVRNHPALDPPRQSLWLSARNARPTRLLELGADQDWCDEIVWAADGATLAFLVQGARLVVADAAAARVIHDGWLFPPGGYPPSAVARGLELTDDGSGVRFRRCERASGACGARQQVEVGGAGGTRG